MKILFISLSNLKFDVTTPLSEPLGGTESAIAYLTVELAKLGHEVLLMANTENKTWNGVTHLPVSEDIAGLDPDVVVLASAPQAAPGVKKIVPRAKIVLWNHMMPDQPAALHIFNQESSKAIDHVVWVSAVQEGTYRKIMKELPDSKVINNAIAPPFENMFSSAQEIREVKRCRGAYISTPYRGLAVLAGIKELPIEVYSSMRVYQGDDSSFESMYANLKTNDCIDFRGSVSQSMLRDNLRPLSFLVYPCIFAECHSIAILEAMAAGLKVVTTDIAHPQTEYVDSMKSDSGSLEEYEILLRKNINLFRARIEIWSEQIWQQVQYVNREFTWAKRAREWDEYLKNTVLTLKSN